MKDPSTVNAFAEPVSDRHPLAMDIFRALVGLVPRRLHRQQLWPLLDEPLRSPALREAAKLEGAYLDAQTVHELAKLAANRSGDLFDRLWHTRGAPAHPLNGEFFDAVVRPMSMAARDLRWAEWVRRNNEELFTDLKRMENRWRSRKERSLADQLRARWVCGHLPARSASFAIKHPSPYIGSAVVTLQLCST